MTALSFVELVDRINQGLLDQGMLPHQPPQAAMFPDEIDEMEALLGCPFTKELREFMTTVGPGQVSHAGLFVDPSLTKELREEIADDFAFEEGHGFLGGIDSVGATPDDSAVVTGVRSGNSLGFFYFYDLAGPTPGRLTLLRLGYRDSGPLGVFAAPSLRAWLECTLRVVESGRLDPGKTDDPSTAFTGRQFVLENFQDIIETHGCGPGMAMLLN